MRPLHALLVVVALVLVAGLSWLMISGDDSGGLVAPASRTLAAPAEAATTEPLEGVLEAPGEHPATARSVQEGAPEAKAASAVAADRAEAPRTGIAGRVVDREGRPLEGVRVLAAAAGPFQGDVPLDEVDPTSTPWLRIEEAATGADGRFALAVADQPEAALALRRAGHAPHDARVPLRVGERRDLGDLVLEPGVVLEGRVVDSGGRGVGGAELRRVRTGDGFTFRSFESRGALLATSDESGAFRIDQLAIGPWSVQVTHDLHPDAVFHGETERAGDVRGGLVFELEDGLAIRGRVVGVPDDVLEKLVVTAWPEAFVEGPHADRPSVRRRVVPGADGGFVVRGLREGEDYRLQGRAADGRGDLFGRSYTDVVVAGTGEGDVELVYRPETAIAFQVVDGATGEPLTRFAVRAGLQWPMPHVDDAGRLVREYPEGRVRFGNLNPRGSERLSLSVDAVGHARFERDDVVIAAGRDNDLGVIRLEPAPTVTVRVVDDRTNAPIEGARVRLFEAEPEVVEAGMSTRSVEFDVSVGGDGDDEPGDVILGGDGEMQRTDGDGVARLTSLPGKQARIAVTASGYAPSTSAVLRLPEQKGYEHEVRLGPGASVIVRAVDSSGSPVAGVEIAHEGPGGGPQHFGSGDVTDAAGERVFENLAPGKHAFKIGRGESFVAMSSGGEAMMRVSRSTTGGTARPSEDWVEVELAPGANEPVVLTAPSRSDLVGVVTEGGRPLSGATVKLVDPDAAPEMAFMGGGGPEARTNGRGEYLLTGVEVGRRRLEVTHPSRAMPYAVDVEIEEGGDEVDVDLPLTAIQGVVVDHEGEPLAGARVVAKRSEGGTRRAVRMVFVTSDGNDTTGEVIDGDAFQPATTDADGRYELRGVTPDEEIVVEATRDGAQPARSEPLRVAPGETREGVDLELVPGGKLTAVLERADGSAAAMMLVTARFDEGGGVEPKTSFTGPEGRATFDGLRPGRWRIECQALGRGGADAQEIPPTLVEVVAGENPDARVAVP